MAVEFQVYFGKKTADFLKYIAERQNKTIPKLIRRLVFEALETREDKYFSKIADERLANDTVVPDSEVDWEKLLSSPSTKKNLRKMSILTQSGRAAIAASIKEQPIHLAWGSGDANWESSHKVENFFTPDGEITLDHHTIKDVKVFTGQTTYQSSIDYIVDSSTGVIQRTENSSIAADGAVTIEYTQDTPPEPITSATLLKEVGRRVVDEILFCVGDENGELLTPSGRFKSSAVPTNNLYLKFTFDFTDAANQVIRELGVMVGTKVKEKVPPGQRYFEPQDIEDPGILLVLEHTVPLIRSAATRETFSFVVTF